MGKAYSKAFHKAFIKQQRLSVQGWQRKAKHALARFLDTMHGKKSKKHATKKPKKSAKKHKKSAKKHKKKKAAKKHGGKALSAKQQKKAKKRKAFNHFKRIMQKMRHNGR